MSRSECVFLSLWLPFLSRACLRPGSLCLSDLSYDRNMSLRWQSKLVLLLVLPIAGADVVLQTHVWLAKEPQVALWTLGMCAFFGVIVWAFRAGTPGAALAGACIGSSLMFSTSSLPYSPVRTAFAPLLCVVVLGVASTRLGRGLKQQLGAGEDRRGRVASQIAANLGVAMLVVEPLFRDGLGSAHLLHLAEGSTVLGLTPMLAAFAEAAADTVSSEVGQVLGGAPRLITSLKVVEAGTDGAISGMGTVAGVCAALLVSAVGGCAVMGGWSVMGDWSVVAGGTLGSHPALGSLSKIIAISVAGGVFGLFFDSLLGATLERRGWLNNDAVNFLSTLAAAIFAAVLVVSI